MFAGADTSSITLQLCAALLAMRPELQQELIVVDADGELQFFQCLTQFRNLGIFILRLIIGRSGKIEVVTLRKHFARTRTKMQRIAKFITGLVVARWLALRLIKYYINAHFLLDHHKIPLPELASPKNKAEMTLFGRLELARRLPSGTTLFKKVLLGFLPSVVTTNPKHVTVISKLAKPERFKLFGIFIGLESVLFQDGERAKRDRHQLNLAFGVDTLQNDLFPAMKRSALLLKERLEIAGANGFDAFQEFSTTTFDVVTEGSFGVSVGSSREAFLQLLEIGLSPVTFLPFGVEFLKWYHARALNTVQTAVDSIYAKRLADGPSSGKKDLLQVMMDLDENAIEPGVTKQQWIQDNLRLFMFAGADTSSVTLQFACALLATRPEMQKEMIEEIQSVVGEDRELQFQHLQRLKLVEAVIKETLRLYTPAAGVVRVTPDDDLVIDGFSIPAGTVVSCDVALMHRREDLFSKPDEFVPKRWIPGASTETASEEAFLPFSAGPRSCVGRHFAMMELKIILATLLLDGSTFKPAGKLAAYVDGTQSKGVLSPMAPVKLVYSRTS